MTLFQLSQLCDIISFNQNFQSTLLAKYVDKYNEFVCLSVADTNIYTQLHKDNNAKHREYSFYIEARG